MITKYIKGVIFDLDGTLADSIGMWAEVDREFFARRGMELPEDYQEAIKAFNFNSAAAYTKKRFNLPESESAIADEWRGMAIEEYANHIKLKPGAREYVLSLKQHGVKIGLATASGRELYEPLLRRHGILDCFDAFATTMEVGKSKEHPDVFLICAKRLGVEPGCCLVFEDILPAVRGAKLAGMTVSGVYDKHSVFDHDSMRAEADLFIDDFYSAPVVEL